LLLALILLAAAMRVVPGWPSVIEGGRAVISDPDACYHLRRAEVIGEGFPTLGIYDSYLNHPSGALVIWPPLYDLVLAGALHVAPGSGPGRGPGPALALLPPLLFALSVLVVWLVARRLWPGNVPLCLISAGVAAFLPAGLPYTSLGHLDHHAAEILLAILFVFAFGRALDRLRHREAPPLQLAVAPGLVLAAGLLVQLSLVVLIAVALAALAWPRQPEPRPAFQLGTFLFAVALAAVLPWSIAYHLAGAPLSHHRFGLFQPALLAAAALVSGVGWLLADWCSGARSSLRAALLVAVAVSLAGLLVVVIPEVVGGTAFLTGSFSLWVTRIGESRSLLELGPAAALTDVVSRLSPLALLLPVGLVLWIGRGLHGSAVARGLVAYTAVFLPLAVLQARFMPHLSLVVGLAAAAVAESLLSRRSAKPLASTVMLCVAGVALIPALRHLRTTDAATEGFRQARSVLHFLATETPVTSHYLHPQQRAEYGVAAVWSYGHFVKYYGRRPTGVDNFGDHVGDVGVIREALLSSGEAGTLERLRSLEVRYLMVGELAPTFSGLVPDDAETRRFVVGGWQTSGDMAAVEFRPPILDTVLYRVTMQNGCGVMVEEDQRYVPALTHFRLVAESEQRIALAPGKSLAVVKLYEIVPGARIRMEGCPPHAAAGMVASVRSPSGHAFPYIQSTSVDRDGVLELVVPYPTRDRAGASFLERGEVWVGNTSLPVPRLTVDDVAQGRTVPWPAQMGIAAAQPPTAS